jgi:hypothetical protein
MPAKAPNLFGARQHLRGKLKKCAIVKWLAKLRFCLHSMSRFFHTFTFPKATFIISGLIGT